MAQTVSNLRTSTASGNTSNKYLFVTDITSKQSTKIALDNVFPSLQSGIASAPVTAGTAGATSLDLFVGGGSGSAQANTSKSVLIFKGLGVQDSASNSAITIRNEVMNADANKQNLIVKLDQTKIKLDKATNTTAKFLGEAGATNPITLSSAAHVGTPILRVVNGSTGLATVPVGSLLVGNTTSAMTTVAMATKGHLLVGQASAAPTTLTAGTNGYFLKADSSTTSGLSWGQVSINSAVLSNTLDLANNNIDIGTGIISGDGSSTKGLRLSNTSHEVFIGTMANSRFDSSLNVDSSITLGSVNGTTAQSILMAPCTTGSTPALNIVAAAASGTGNTGGSFNITAGIGDTNGNGGNLVLKAGAGAGSGNGGSVQIHGGVDGGSGTDGPIAFYTGGSLMLTIGATGLTTFGADMTIGGVAPKLTIGDGGAEDSALVFDGNAQDYYVGLDDTDDILKIGLGSAIGTTPAISVDSALNTTLGGHAIITAATDGLVHTGSGTVTQATNHTTGVTINATSGVIQLAAVALANATNAEFTVTNSTVQADSVILLTIQDENTTNNAQLSVATHTIAGGSFKINVHHADSAGATSATASKIHFLIINNSV